LEELARKNQAAYYGNQHDGGLKEKFPEVQTGQVRDKLAASIGVSGRTIDTRAA